MSLRTVALGALVLIAAACGDGNPGGPSGSGSGSGSGTVTATIDGVAYTGTVNRATNINGVLNVASNSADLTRAIAFAGPAAAGTTTVAAGTLSMTVQTTNGATVTGAWVASQQFGSGTLSVTLLTPASATGIFNFNGVSGPGSPAGTTGTKAVINGRFTVNF